MDYLKKKKKELHLSSLETLHLPTLHEWYGDTSTVPTSAYWEQLRD